MQTFTNLNIFLIGRLGGLLLKSYLILLILLVGTTNAWANTYYYSGQGNGTNWAKKAMTVSTDGFYEYYLVSSTTTHQFKIGTSSNQYAYNHTYVSKNFNGTNIVNIGDYGGDNCYCWQGSKHYILVYYPSTTVNSASQPKICAATYLPDNRECTVYFINKDNWNSVNAYGWYYQNSTDGSNNGWPGKAMTNTGKTYNGKQIWSYTYPQTYDKAIFNNGSNQTSDLTLGTTNKGNMYDYPNSKWIDYTYDVKVTFNANGHGTDPTAKTVLKGGKVTAPTAPTATGYTFGGWYKEANCTNAFNFNTAITADITLYAKWTANKYTVTLDNQGATTAGTASVQATYGSAMPSITIPTRTGYTFNGYYDAISGGTQYYKADGSSARTWNKTAATTLYAQWTANQYTITYKDQGNIAFSGTHTSTPPTKHTYGTATTLKTATKTGYAFGGWYTTQDCSGSAITTLGATAYTAAITLYAKWNELPPTTVYLQPVDYWLDANARFAVYAWNNSGNEWIEMEDVGCNRDYFTANIPARYKDFKFVRLNPNAENFSFDEGITWHKTPDMTIPIDGKNLFTYPCTYLKPNSNWKTDGARFAARFYQSNGSSEIWKDMTDTDGDGYYSCETPNGYDMVIFCRMNPRTTENNWDNRWNQTGNLSILEEHIDSGNCFTLYSESWDSGEWTTHWTTFSPPKYDVTLNATNHGTTTATYNSTTKTSKSSGTSTLSNVPLNELVTFTFTPAEGYQFANAKITIGNQELEVFTSTFTYPICGPATISAHFVSKETRTIYLRPNDEWLTDAPAFAAYAYKKNSDVHQWYVMNTADTDYTGAYSCEVSSTYDHIHFVRINPRGVNIHNQGINWENAWNQTISLEIVDQIYDTENKKRFVIEGKTEKDNENENHYDGKWEENTPIWGVLGDFNTWHAEQAVFMGYPGKLNQLLSYRPTHQFKLYNFPHNHYYYYEDTYTRKDSEEWWKVEYDGSNHKNTKIIADVDRGIYLFQLKFETESYKLTKQISVTYPDAAYFLAYKEGNDESSLRISRAIAKVNEDTRFDTISFFVNLANTPDLYLYEGIDKDNLEFIKAYNIHSEIDGVKENYVWNFILEQTNNINHQVQLLIDGTHKYANDYYVRTDGATGGWDDYVQAGNKMTHFVHREHMGERYNHYWVAALRDEDEIMNVSGNVACLYNDSLASIIKNDRYTDVNGNVTITDPSGDSPEKVNLRFGYNPNNNYFERAMLTGSSHNNEFLNIIGDKIYKEETLQIPLTTAEASKFGDISNWVYEKDVYVPIKNINEEVTVSLTAKAYNGETQSLFGFESDGTPSERVMIGKGTSPQDYYKMRVIYDFKTNRMIMAWIPGEKTCSNDINIETNVLFIRKENEEVPQFNANGKNITGVKDQFFALEFTGGNDPSKLYEEHYWFSLPYNCIIGSITGIHGYMEAWGIQRYRGDLRAKNGWWAETETFWEWMTPNDTLKAGEGYVLSFDKKAVTWGEYDGQYIMRLYFPAIDQHFSFSTTNSKEVTYPNQPCTIERDDRYQQDGNWKIIGPCSYNNATPYTVGINTAEEEVWKPDGYTWSAPMFRYSYTYDNSTEENRKNKWKYVPEDGQTSTYNSFYGYMVQFAGTINWQGLTQSQVPNSVVARKRVTTEKNTYTTRLEIVDEAGAQHDQTFVALNDSATFGNDLNMDLNKIFNSYWAQLYTISDNVEYAGNTLPMGKQIVPLGIDIPTSGTYTLRMPDGTDGISVTLVDNATGTHTDMLLNEYTVTLDAGTIENRFYLVVDPDRAATSVENVGEEAKGVKKFLIDGKLIIRTADGIFDAQGHKL